MPTKVLRLPCVKDRTGLARSTIYAHMAADTFPSPHSTSLRCVGWLESDIEDWLRPASAGPDSDKGANNEPPRGGQRQMPAVYLRSKRRRHLLTTDCLLYDTSCPLHSVRPVTTVRITQQLLDAYRLDPSQMSGHAGCWYKQTRHQNTSKMAFFWKAKSTLWASLPMPGSAQKTRKSALCCPQTRANATREGWHEQDGPEYRCSNHR